MKDTARVILTTKCPRRCSYCVNKYPGVLEQARSFLFMHEMVKALAKYQVVCLTGGEPMLVMPEHMIAFAKAIRHAWPGIKIYAYVSDYCHREDLARLMALVDGVNYALHASTNLGDIDRFYGFQTLAKQFHGSHRLAMHPQIVFTPIVITPGCWTRIEMKPWLEPGDCCVPDNEDLYIWRNNDEKRTHSLPSRANDRHDLGARHDLAREGARGS